MAIRAKQSTWPFIVLLLVAGGIWLKDQWEAKEGAVGASDVRVEESPAKPLSDGWERIEGCRWVEHDRNDGDSFRLKLPDGRIEEFRLYFVDAPESAFRNYGGGRNNHKRISEQARSMRLTSEEVVKVGKEAKALVREWCANRQLSIVTRWEDPFGDRRYHALIEMPGGGEPWLHERLVGAGLVRIHTKGSKLPDGKSESAQTKHLKELESAARSRREGAWGMGG